MDGDILTDDEKLLRHPRWQGETVDLRTRILNMFSEHRAYSGEDVWDSEDAQALADDLVTLIRQLSGGAPHGE